MVNLQANGKYLQMDFQEDLIRPRQDRPYIVPADWRRVRTDPYTLQTIPKEPCGGLLINRMKNKFSHFSFLFLVCLFSVPALLKAQGNHCVVSKSPFRLSIDSGKLVYAMQCTSCHQPDGMGNSNINPPLNGKRVTGDKKYLIGIIIQGVANHDSTAGKTYQGQMLANPTITDKEIADVLTYVRNSFGNRAAAIKEKDVKTIRSGLK